MNEWENPPQSARRPVAPFLEHTKGGGGALVYFVMRGTPPGVPEAACLFCKVSGIFRQILEHSPPHPPLFNGSSCAPEAGTDKKFRSFLGRSVGGAGGGFIGCHGDGPFLERCRPRTFMAALCCVAGTLSGSGWNR